MAESALHSVLEEPEPLLHKQATEPKGRKGSSEASSVAAGPEASSIVYSVPIRGPEALGLCVPST